MWAGTCSTKQVPVSFFNDWDVAVCAVYHDRRLTRPPREALFTDTERGKDAFEDVVRRSFARDFSQGIQRVVHIDRQEFR